MIFRDLVEILEGKGINYSGPSARFQVAEIGDSRLRLGYFIFPRGEGSIPSIERGLFGNTPARLSAIATFDSAIKDYLNVARIIASTEDTLKLVNINVQRMNHYSKDNEFLTTALASGTLTTEDGVNVFLDNIETHKDKLTSAYGPVLAASQRLAIRPVNWLPSRVGRYQ